jgi:3-oxoacyl-[acyl-carrier-protein] synthase II
MQRVFITGSGVVSPLGNSVGAFWENLNSGQTGCRTLQLEGVADAPVQIAAELTDKAFQSHFPNKLIARMSDTSLFVCEAVRQALGQGGGLRPQAGLGLFLGISVGGFVEMERHLRAFFEKRRVSPFSILAPMNSAPAANASIFFGLDGPTLTFDTACSSANHAIGNAYLQIQSGRIDAALAGGADTPFSPGVYMNWCATQILSKDNHNPAQACRPFSRCRTGTVLSEGAGMLLLESERTVKSNGGTPLGEVVGYGATSDAFHQTRGSLDGARKAVQLALKDAGIGPADLGFVSAHGTGTPLNDETEIELLEELLRDTSVSAPPRVSATKGATGHPLAASGAIEAVLTMLATASSTAPPTINCLDPDPRLRRYLTCDGPAPVSGPYSVSNSFGFGGSNAVIVMRRL